MSRQAKAITPDRSRALLVKQASYYHGVSYAQVARDCGVTRGMVSHVAHGRKRCPRVERALARLCGIPANELFPKRAKAPRPSRAR